MRSLVLAMLAAVCLGCGPGAGSGEREADGGSIGTSGGSVVSSDGAVRLDVPAGALDRAVAIRIGAGAVTDVPAQLRDAAEITRVVRLEPDGLTFAKPARISFRLPATTEGDRVRAAIRALLSRSGERVEMLASPVAEVDLDAGAVTVSAELSHFSEVWDSLPKGSGVTVAFSGVPSTWSVGPAFEARATVQYRNGKTNVTGIYFVDNGSTAPITPRMDRRPDGTLSPAERTLASSDEPGYPVGAGLYGATLPYSCGGVGEGLWAAKVELTTRDLEDYATMLAAGSPVLKSGYRAGAHRDVRCGAVSAGQPTAAATARTGSPVVSTASPTPAANRRPVVKAVTSKIAAPTTTYTIEAEDPDGDALTYEWAMTGEACGTPKVPWSVTAGASVTWKHSADPPDRCTHLTREHDVVTTVVVMEAGTPRLRCTIPGSEDRRLEHPICETLR